MQYFSVNYIHPKNGYSVFVKFDSVDEVRDVDIIDHVIENELMDEEEANQAYIESISEEEYYHAMEI